MSSIFGLEDFSYGYNMLKMETVLSVQREDITDIVEEGDVAAASSLK